MRTHVEYPSRETPDAMIAIASRPATAVRDAFLLADYDPARSLAWPGAVPRSAQAAQGDLFDAFAPLTAADAASDLAFRRAGFIVRPLAGLGSRRVLSAFCAAHHYLGTAGMAGGVAFGLYAPTDLLVGVANFARPTNSATAAGMFPRVYAEPDVEGKWATHLSVAESEVLDFVRFTVRDSAEVGLNLGVGAESYFQRAALRWIEQRNRARWRAVRMLELGLTPDDPDLLTVATIKSIRTFADPVQAHRGTIYVAAGWYAAGTSRAGKGWVGERTGQSLSGRQRAKLHKLDEAGHDNNVLRAAYEGATGCTAEAFDATGHSLGLITLDAIAQARAATPAALKLAFRSLASTTNPTAAEWTLRYGHGGFREIACPAKPRFLLFLGAPTIARRIARSCHYLHATLTAADHAFFAPDRRGTRGHGFNWPRRPTDTALLTWARAHPRNVT
jgi:hypothetical protein